LAVLLLLKAFQGFENGDSGTPSAHNAPICFGTWPLPRRQQASFQQREIPLSRQDGVRFLPIGPASYGEILASFLQLWVPCYFPFSLFCA
jgi:hypothetical protein